MKADIVKKARLRCKKLKRRLKLILIMALTGFLPFSFAIVVTIATSPKEAVNAQECCADVAETEESCESAAQKAASEPLTATVDIVSLAAGNEAQKAVNAQESCESAAETEERCESAAQKATESPDYSADEAYMLAKMAMAEAESEDTEGKALVILVILNRVESGNFPNTIEEVISQTNAFTSYKNGRYDAVEPDKDCWAALELIETDWDGSYGALYFERTPKKGESTWHSKNLERLFTHGAHTFYREAREATE